MTYCMSKACQFLESAEPNAVLLRFWVASLSSKQPAKSSLFLSLLLRRQPGLSATQAHDCLSQCKRTYILYHVHIPYWRVIMCCYTVTVTVLSKYVFGYMASVHHMQFICCRRLARHNIPSTCSNNIIWRKKEWHHSRKTTKES